MKYFIFIFLVFFYSTLRAQSKYPIDLYMAGYGYLALTNDINLNDTVQVIHSENVYFRFVLFDPKGKSYFEIYKDKKLFSKGYYENSLDTLKTYTSAVPIGGKPSKIEIHKYFQPLKNGEWIELVKGKYIKKKYNMGIEE